VLTNSKKPLIVFLFLLVASLACYSDSPLWVFGVTDVPPTTTYLPTPGTGPDEYPAKLNRGDLALAPKPISASQAFFFVTHLPEDLLSGVRNAGGSCDYNAQLEILYVGNQFDEFAGNVYIDNIALSTTVEGQDPITDSLFDFEEGTSNWSLNTNFPSGTGLELVKDEDFAGLAGVSQLEETVAALADAIASAQNISIEEADDLQAKLDSLDIVIANLQNTTVDDLRTLQTNIDDALAQLRSAQPADLEAISQSVAGFVTGDLTNTSSVLETNSAVLADLENVSADDRQAILDQLEEALPLDRENVSSNLQSALVEQLQTVLAGIEQLEGIDLSGDTSTAITAASDLLGDAANASTQDLDARLTALSDSLTQERDNLQGDLNNTLVTRLNSLLDFINSNDLLRDRGDVLVNLENARIAHEITLDNPEDATADELRDAFDDIFAALEQDRDDIIVIDAAVENDTAVLQLATDYKTSDLVAATSVRFAEDGSAGVDWSAFSEMSFEVFVAPSTAPFLVRLDFKTGDGETVTTTTRYVLDSGLWTTINVDLSTLGDLSDVREMGIEIGPDPAHRYYLIECSGTVGWANEVRLAGPVVVVPGQSALTRNTGSRDNPLPDGSVFGVAAGQEPPRPNSGPVFDDASQNCLVGEVVDVESVFAYDDNTDDHQLWYLIDCANGRGWVAESRLYGPLVLPENNGIGLISSVYADGADLTANPGPSGDANPVVGTCASDQFIETQDFSAIAGETEGDLISYYYIQCGEDLAGWTEQSVLLEIPYLVDTSTIVIGPPIVEFVVDEPLECDPATDDCGEQVDGTTEEEAGSVEKDVVREQIRILRTDFASGEIDSVQLGDELRLLVVGESGDASSFGRAQLTIEPGLPLEENIAGECSTGTVLDVENVRSADGIVYYQVTCGETTGWIDSRYLPYRAELELESTLWFVRPSTTGGDEDDGFSITVQPDPVGIRVGECALFLPVTVERVVLYEKAIKSQGLSLYYEISCEDLNGVQISGFVEQRNIVPEDATQGIVVLDRDPTTLIGG
jgi:hypothetical protein